MSISSLKSDAVYEWCHTARQLMLSVSGVIRDVYEMRHTHAVVYYNCPRTLIVSWTQPLTAAQTEFLSITHRHTFVSLRHVLKMPLRQHFNITKRKQLEFSTE